MEHFRLSRLTLRKLLNIIGPDMANLDRKVINSSRSTISAFIIALYFFDDELQNFICNIGSRKNSMQLLFPSVKPP